MNFNSTDLFSRLDTNLTNKERDGIIEDLIELQDKMHPLGIVKDVNDLLVLKDSSLLMVLMWQHELFAISHFHLRSKEIMPTVEVVDSDNKTTLYRISNYFRNIFK